MAPSAAAGNLSFSRRFKAFRLWLNSRRAISVFKGALAFTLAVMLPLIPAFDRLNKVPLTYSAGVVIAIAGFPGKSTGECFFGASIALLGVGLGAGNFALLSLLHNTLVAQAIVFAVMVYLLSILKGLDPRLFAFSLLAILMTFNGVYISILTKGFSKVYLESYFKSYLWGGVIVLGVNLLIFPISSERELRQTLVLSLEHIGTFSHLLAKTYTLSITDEERQIRDQLNQTIRADFGLLTQKVGAAAIEINYSRWSIQDYQVLVSQTRTMQLSLIALYSSLAPAEKTPAPIFEDRFLPSTIHPFHQLRRDVHRTIVEIQLELGCKATKVFGASAFATYFDLEKQDEALPQHESEPKTASEDSTGKDAENGEVPVRPGILHTQTDNDVNERLRAVSARLQREAEAAAPHPDDPEDGAETTIADSEAASRLMTQVASAGRSAGSPGDLGFKPRGCAKRLVQHFQEFEQLQRDLFTEILASGALLGPKANDTELYVHLPQPSIWDTYGPDHVRGLKEANEQLLRDRKKQKAQGPSKIFNGIDAPFPENSPDDAIANDAAAASNHSLMRVFTVMYAMSQFTTTLANTHALVKKKDAKGRPRQKRLRFHLFEGIGKKPQVVPSSPSQPPSAGVNPVTAPAPAPGAAVTEYSKSDEGGIEASDDHPPTSALGGASVPPSYPLDGADNHEITMKEAMAMLEGRTYTSVKPTLWQRIDKIEKSTRSPLSVYAAKVAGAAMVFGALLWADGTRPFFEKYSIAGSLLTIVVALTPTLGQSLRSFVLQIAGSSTGYIVGLIIMEIFKGVGGYKYNPYGIVCLVAVYSVPMSYLLYEKPQIFTFTLLAMNACGVLIDTDYVSLSFSRNAAYGQPPLRVARSLAGLAIALAIVIAFQLFVLRNPARRTLRKALANLVYSNMSYNNILQAFVRGTMTTDSSWRPSQKAIDRVLAELAHREKKIQSEILSCLPLVAFASDEPQLVKPFQAAAITKIIRANQIILDRQSEARSAIGRIPFSEDILQQFIGQLSPYRTRFTQTIRTRFCLAAASLSSKTPLPHDTNFQVWVGGITHDALLQSQRFAQTEAGKKSIQNGEFTRYWFYFLTISSITEQLGVIEDACRTLFGELEDDPRLA